MMVSYDSSKHNEQELNREVLGGHQNNFFSNFGHMASRDWMVVNNESGRS